MPREVKPGRRAFLEETAPHTTSLTHLGGAPAPRSLPPLAGRRGASTRWFAAHDPRGVPLAVPRRATLATVAPLLVVLLLALSTAVLLERVAPRMLLPLAVLTALAALIWGFGVVLRRRAASSFARRASPESARPEMEQRTSSPWELSSLPPRASELRSPGRGGPAVGRGIALDGERLAFRSGRGLRMAGQSEPMDTLLVLDAPFGVTLLASPRRDRVIALLSSAMGTFYLGAAFDAAARRAFAPLLDRSFTVVGDDPGMEAIGPDGDPLVLAPDELASLLDALVEQSPSCLERFVLTDARGKTLTLDGRSLCVGDRAVDLNAPLEWKPIVFQEAFGETVAVYQGTWIRQSSTELTLVSLLPALGAAPGADLDLGSLDRAVLRDLRLMQASPEVPPPSEQRVAIDRLFMLPVRSALDRAPRASHQTNRAQA